MIRNVLFCLIGKYKYPADITDKGNILFKLR